MQDFHDVLRYVHITGGVIGLVLFWIPLLSKKGSPIHKKLGKIWIWLARVVLISAFAGLMMYIPELLSKGQTISSHPDSYSFILFLGYLSIVTFVITFYAVDVLKYKNQINTLASLRNRTMAFLCIISSVLLLLFAFIYQPKMKIVMFALSPIGLTTGWGMLKYMAGKEPSKRGWLYEHLGSVLGAGIAFHTAFAVFGLTRMFDIGLNGWIAVIPWVLPAAIGIPASIIWRRHYQKKFNEIPA